MVRRRALVPALAVPVLVAGLSACAAPEYRYAAEKPGAVPAGSVYFKVPESWSELGSAQVAAAEKDWASDSDAAALLSATTWQAAYDASTSPSLDHVLGRGVPDAPTVYASLRALYPQEQSAVTTDSLKDMVVPVSTLGSAVRIRTDEPVRQGGAHGVHLVFSYAPGGGQPEETIDQTSYLSDGKDAVYLLVVRCSTSCYDAHRDQIGTVTSSYTIQEGRSG